MKTIHLKMIIPAGLGLLGISSALAIEPPKDDAPPPPSVKAPTSAPAKADDFDSITHPRVAPAAASTAFIGIISDDVPEMVASHIGLRTGEGVMIRDLAPGGPAEKAGFAKFDVITHVSGKTVGSPADLSREISASKPGDEISIDLIHQGEKASKIVKLETRPEEAGRVLDPRQLGHLDLDDMPEGQAERIREMIDRQLRGMMGERREFKQLDRPMLPPSDNDNGIRGFQFKSDATFRLMDNDGSIEMKSSDGKKHITVRNHDGKEIWSGPWDTEQDKEAAPKEIRERIEKFKFDDGFSGGGFRFRMGGAGGRDRDDVRDDR